LVKKGYSHRTVTMLYLLLAVLSGGCGLAYLHVGEPASALALAFSLVTMLALFVGVTLVEMR
jgi:hypothetical protein